METKVNSFQADNLSGKNHTGAHPNMPLKFLTATSIIGDVVTNPAGEKLGVIKDIMIDLGMGKIEYIILELGGFLGMGEKFFALPYTLLKVDAKNSSFVLSQSKDTLEKAPGFNKDHWPETNSHEFDNASSYWGGFIGPHTGAIA